MTSRLFIRYERMGEVSVLELDERELCSLPDYVLYPLFALIKYIVKWQQARSG